MFTPTSAAYHASVLERQDGTIAALTLEQMCHLFHLKRAIESVSITRFL